MGRYLGSKNKLARREGEDLSLKTPGSANHARLLRKIKIKPGQHGQKMRGKLSDFGKQLREKQKVKRIYGIIEKQFRKYYDKAARFPGVTGDMLLQTLERRLDNVVYRLGLAPTRASARQLVGHGHILVNERKVDIPSYQVAIGDIISLTSKTLSMPSVAKMLEEKTLLIPSWLEKKAALGKVIALPKREDIKEAINEQMIVEFYSR